MTTTSCEEFQFYGQKAFFFFFEGDRTGAVSRGAEGILQENQIQDKKKTIAEFERKITKQIWKCIFFLRPVLLIRQLYIFIFFSYLCK